MCIDPENADDGDVTLESSFLFEDFLILILILDFSRSWPDDQFVHNAGKSWLTLMLSGSQVWL